MANPLDLLPLIDGSTYTFFNQEVSNEQIGPGNRKKLEIGAGRGFYFGTVTTIIGKGGEKTELSITVDDFRADTTPQELYESGFVNPQGIAPGVSRYDTTNDIYTAIHNPQRIIGYNDTVKFAQRASNESEGVVVDATIFSIGITRPREFTKQYLKLVNPGFGNGDTVEEFLQTYEEDLQ